MERFRVAVVTAAVSVAAAGYAPIQSWAQTPTSSDKTGGQAQSEYVFRSNVRRVPVDVIVLNKNGDAVHGLTEKDFIVEEDKKPQAILSFDSFDGKATAYVPPKIPT